MPINKKRFSLCVLLVFVVFAAIFFCSAGKPRHCRINILNANDHDLANPIVRFPTHETSLPRIPPGQSLDFSVPYDAIRNIKVMPNDGSTELLETGFTDAPGFYLSDIKLTVHDDINKCVIDYDHAWTYALVKVKAKRFLAQLW